MNQATRKAPNVSMFSRNMFSYFLFLSLRRFQRMHYDSAETYFSLFCFLGDIPQPPQIVIISNNLSQDQSVNKETIRQQRIQSNNNGSDNEVRELQSLSKSSSNPNKNLRSPIVSNYNSNQNENQALLSMMKGGKFFL